MNKVKPSFRDLHHPGKPFVMANAWDMGSARLLAGLGAAALATTSAGHAFTLGRPDMGNVSREEAISHASSLAGATFLPVSADLENGFGHSPQDVVDTVKAAAAAGLAGCGIEDTALPDLTPYSFELAVERIEAAAEACRLMKQDFVLTARADGFMNGQYDLEEAIRRVKAFERVGADVLYVPYLPNIDELKNVCLAVEAPVNVVCESTFARYSYKDFADAGAARISLGASLCRVANRAVHDAMKSITDSGDFSTLGNVYEDSVIDDLLAKGS